MKKPTVKKSKKIAVDEPGRKAVDEEKYGDETSFLDEEEPEIIDEEGITDFEEHDEDED